MHLVKTIEPTIEGLVDTLRERYSDSDELRERILNLTAYRNSSQFIRYSFASVDPVTFLKSTTGKRSITETLLRNNRFYEPLLYGSAAINGGTGKKIGPLKATYETSDYLITESLVKKMKENDLLKNLRTSEILEAFYSEINAEPILETTHFIDFESLFDVEGGEEFLNRVSEELGLSSVPDRSKTNAMLYAAAAARTLIDKPQHLTKKAPVVESLQELLEVPVFLPFESPNNDKVILKAPLTSAGELLGPRITYIQYLYLLYAIVALRKKGGNFFKVSSSDKEEQSLERKMDLFSDDKKNIRIRSIVYSDEYETNREKQNLYRMKKWYLSNSPEQEAPSFWDMLELAEKKFLRGSSKHQSERLLSIVAAKNWQAAKSFITRAGHSFAVSKAMKDSHSVRYQDLVEVAYLSSLKTGERGVVTMNQSIQNVLDKKEKSKEDIAFILGHLAAQVALCGNNEDTAMKNALRKRNMDDVLGFINKRMATESTSIRTTRAFREQLTIIQSHVSESGVPARFTKAERFSYTAGFYLAKTEERDTNE